MLSTYDPIIRNMPHSSMGYYYQISENAEIYCRSTGKQVFPRLYKGHLMIDGRPIHIYNTDKVRIDEMLALLFVPKTEDKTIVYHVDGNNLNNKLSNLKWVNKENLINRNIKKTNNPLMKGIVYFKAPFGTNYWLCTAKKDGKQKRITFTMSYEGLQEALNWKSEREKELYYF